MPDRPPQPVTDHADTIRRAFDFRPYWNGQDKAVSEGRRALDALLAERQQALDELDAALDKAESRRRAWFTTEQRFQQAIDALRRIAKHDCVLGLSAASKHEDDRFCAPHIARAALAQLGEQA